ncbi:MAG TPA: diaminopimelate epimerase [Gemmatimonadales bacterium]|nr:diaminopimelate epimerase [Gemmatimonadales bacterium]
MEGAAPAAHGLVRPHLVGLPIYKMTGSGNDFVMLDARVSAPADWTAEDMQAVCARGTGIGADGVVFVGPGSKPGAARMIYYNSDGSHANMCGNAALCSTTLAVHLGVGPAAGMDLETDAGTYRSRTAEPGRAELNLAAVDPPAAVSGLELAPGEAQAVLTRVGVPHLIVVVDDVDNVALMERGRALRFDPALAPEGANINFISVDKNSVWRMRTYERGVEGETLACGTGAVGAGCAIQEWGLGRLPITIQSRSGRTLGVRATRAQNGRYDDVWLAGEGRMVFRGVIT